MNSVLLNYILKNFSKSLLMVILIVFCFGIILNLFEEIEFFKNSNAGALKPFFLTILLVPSLIIKLLPFIIFISSMWFMIKIRNNNDLLILKIYGYSNLKIFSILAVTSFLFGWIVLSLVSPVTSTMVQYYEKTKSTFARDIDHLVTFNKNGLWMKESLESGGRIISAENINGTILSKLTIFEFNKEFTLKKKIFSEKADIKTNKWFLSEVTVFNPANNIFKKKSYDSLILTSVYDYQKITNLFSNSDTISFVDLIINYRDLISKGYNKQYLDQTYQTMLTLPFFLFLMTAIAAILTLYTLKKEINLKFIFLGLIICVIVYYFKDLSIALGKTDRIPLILSIWSPVIALSFFTFIGVLQINEN